MGVEAELEAPEHGLKRTLKDLFSGAVGGVAQVLLGMYDSYRRYDTDGIFMVGTRLGRRLPSFVRWFHRY